MPKVRYTFRAGDGDEFSEDYILPQGSDIELPGKQQVMLWNEKIEENNAKLAPEDREPDREFVEAKVVDAFLHEHEWVVTISRKTTGKDEYVKCQHCPVEGKRILDGDVTRDKKWQSDFHEFCHEKKPQLRPPKFK